MLLNSLSFCLSVKLLSSPSYLNDILAGYSSLGCRLFSFITLSMSCHTLLAWRVSTEGSAVILMGICLCAICCFSLAAFNICSLCLIFVNLINMCLGVFHLGFILFETFWVSWTMVTIFFPILREVKHLVLLYWLYQSLWLCGSQKTGKFLKRWEYQTTLSASWEICVQVKKQQIELDMEQ